MQLNNNDATQTSDAVYASILPVEENLKLEPKYFRIAGEWVCKWVVVSVPHHQYS